MLTSAQRVLGDFEGSWALTRRITHADGSQAVMDGSACWVRAGDDLEYHEIGLLTLEGAPPIRAERRYRWAQDLSVYFEDGRFFHRVPAAGGTVSHDCPPDTYEGIYDFSGWPDFEVSWLVSGPAKDYHLHSIYRRTA